MRNTATHAKRGIRIPALAWAAAGTPHTGLAKVGAQSYSFREFALEDALKRLEELGLDTMEFCRVHFEPGIAAAELERVKACIAGASVSVSAYGVEGFSADAAANRNLFAFAKNLGTTILSADPTPQAFDSLDTLCEEYQIKIAIHNHGPEARYDKVQDTLDAVAGRHPLVGACVDTGHSIRSGEAPDEVIARLGERVHSVHLKDWKQGGDEQVLGEGDLDLAKTAKALKAIGFSGPIAMEFELSPEAPVAGMKQGLANWRRAVAAVA